jgi:hypothetical protein
MAVTTLRDYTAESILEHLGDLENHPKETLVTYEEFLVDDKTYYFTPGGFPVPQGPRDGRGGRLLLRLPQRRGMALQDC